MTTEGPVQKPPAAPEHSTSNESPTPPTFEEQISSEDMQKARGVVIEFLDALRSFEPKDERGRITFRILMEQLFAAFGGNTDRLWEGFGSNPPVSVYAFLTTAQENPITKKTIPPILKHAEKRAVHDTPPIAGEWELNDDALRQHLKNFMLWQDRERGVKEARDVSFGHAQNLIVHIFGGKNYFNAPIQTISGTVEDLRRQERGIKRDIARSDYRSSLFKSLGRMGVSAEEISVKISGEEKYLQSNPDGTIDMKIDWIEIRDAKLSSGRELTDDVQKQIGASLRLVNIRSPRYTRWITYDPAFEIRFTAGKEDRTLLGRVPRSELGLDIAATPESRDAALLEIGQELNKIAQPRTRILKPYLAQGQLRIILSDVPHHQGSDEHFAPPRVEELVKRLMHFDRKFATAFLSGKQSIAQVFGDDLAEYAATPRYKKFVEKREKEGDAYLPAKEPSATEHTEGVVKITSTEAEIARTVSGKEVQGRIFSDWERREAQHQEANEAVASHHQKFLLLRRFYEALASYSRPSNPRIEKLARAVGIVVSNESSLAHIGEIGEVLYKLSAADKNAVSKANTYFNHFYSVFDEMELATYDAAKKGVTLNADKIAEHAKEYLSGKALKAGTNIFKLAESHGFIGKNPEKQAVAIEERLAHEGEANVQLSPEEMALVKEFSDIRAQLRELSFPITIPAPGESGYEQALAEMMDLGNCIEMSEKVISLVETRDPHAPTAAEHLRRELMRKFGASTV